MGIEDARQAARTAPPAGDTAVALADAPPVPTHYCLDYRHASRLVTSERFFVWQGERHPADHPQAGQLVLVDQGPGLPMAPITSTCPVCPVCTARDSSNIDPLTGLPREVRTSAIPLDYDDNGRPLIPAALLAVAARAGEAQ